MIKETLLIISLVYILCPLDARAGAGHDHGEGKFSGGGSSSSFTLNDTTIHNLDIKTVIADITPVVQSTRMLVQIKLLPEKQAVITPRFHGMIKEINVKLGEKISHDQSLVTLQPIAIGNAPVTLNAPISGVLSRQMVVVGQVIQPGDILMEVSDRTQVLAKGITYDFAGLGSIRQGQTVLVRIDSLPEREFTGTVQRIDPAIHEDQRTFSVFALLDNPEGLLIPHMQGQMEVHTGETELLLTVPTQAVLGTVGQHFLYVRDKNYFEKRDVALGVSRSGLQEIISGVFPGEEVVIQGNYQLQYVTGAGERSLEAAGDDHGHVH